MSTTTPETTLPRDEFSVAMRDKGNHPTGVTKQSVVDLVDFHGNCITWVIRTVRAEGEETVFLQRNDADGGKRFVLPPEVTAVLARHRDGAVAVSRRRGAQSAAATRKARGIQPAFLKAVL